jgi:hypothetical protein
MTGMSLVGLFIDLIVTFSLMYKYKYNEYSVREAVERYNDNLRKKLGIFPDISFNSNDIILGFNYRF